MALHARESVRPSLDDSVYAGQDLAKAMPKYRFPPDELRRRRRLRGGRRRAHARRQLAPEPGDVLPDVGGARRSTADGAGDRQEHDRQGRVPADRRDRAALRAHARRPVERAGGGQHRRRVGDRLVGGLHARRHGGQVALAGEARRRPGSRPTGRTWSAARCRWCGTSSPSTGTSRCARSRCPTATTRWTPTTCSSASTRTRSWSCPRFGVTYTGAYELVKPLADALDALHADTGLGRRHPRRRRERRLPRPVLRPRHRVGLPGAAGQVDQHVGPQVRARPARRRLGRLA